MTGHSRRLYQLYLGMQTDIGLPGVFQHLYAGLLLAPLMKPLSELMDECICL